MVKYRVEALCEPNGEGSGWEQVDSDADASGFGVYNVDEFGGWEEFAETRAEAQAIADRWNK